MEKKGIKMVLPDDAPMPPPVFANNIQVMAAREVTVLTFYAGLLPHYFHPDDLPDEVEARPAAQVVVPTAVWDGLMAEIIAQAREAQPARSEEEPSDG